MPTNRVRNNFLGGVIENSSGLDTGNPIQLQSSGLTEMIVVPQTNQRVIAFITLDPFRRAGVPEIAVVTNHTQGANVASLSRGQDGTITRGHERGIEWLQGPVVSDWDELDAGWAALEKAIQDAVRHQDFSGLGQLVVGAGYGRWTIMGAGAPDTVLVSKTTGSFGVNWERLAWNSLSTTLQNEIMPAGAILPWAGAGTPYAGWLSCNGVSYPKVSYPRLDAVMAANGYPWGTTPDNQSFFVPNLVGRTLVGGPPGQVGGATQVTLTSSQLPPHIHPNNLAVQPSAVETDARLAEPGEGVIFQPATYADLENIFGVSHVPEEAPQVELFRHTHALSGSVGSTGQGYPVDVRPPYATVQWIIKT